MPVLIPEEHMLSLAASATHFNDYGEDQGDEGCQACEQGSQCLAQSYLAEMEDSSMHAIMSPALEQLHMDMPRQAEAASASVFWPAPTALAVAHLENYLTELQACWRDTKAFFCLSADGWTLAAMHKAENWPGLYASH